jgi:tetratricopeptide (TPR) repeat protein
VMQAGSVIGLDFYRGAVAAMSPPEMAAVIGPSLATLTRRRLVRPVPPTLADEPTYRFGHQLIRDAAYAGLLLRRRAELHRRFAEWLDGVAGPRLAELDELVGYHLEQAAHSLSAIGSTDPEDLDVATRAAGRLARAGARAFERGDMPAAANLHRRAVELLPATSEERPRLLLDLAEISADLGEIPVAAGLLDEALAAARDRADARLETNARLVRLYVRYTLDPHGESDAVVSAVRAAAPVLEAVEDHEGLVRAWRLLGWVHATACHYGAAEQAVSRAVEEARLAGDRRAVTRNQMSFAVSALHGPMPVGDAIVRCERILAEVAEDRRAEGVVLGALSHLMAMDGRFEDARGLYRRARTTLEELGGSIMAATVSLDSGRVELLAGDPRAAERELRRDFDVLERIGERYALSSVAALLARALLLQGRRTDAIRFAQSSEAAAAPDDVEAQNLWRRVRALSLAEDGDRRAIDLIDDALEMLRSADAPVLSAGTLLDRAEIHARLGEPALARAAAQAANERFIEKGDRVEAQRAARLLDAIAGDRPA